MKAPLFFAGPGIPRGRSEALDYLLDVYPALAELGGCKVCKSILATACR